MNETKIYQLNLDSSLYSIEEAEIEAKKFFPNCNVSVYHSGPYMFTTVEGTLDAIAPGIVKYFYPEKSDAVEFFALDNDISEEEAEDLLHDYWQNTQNAAVEIWSSSEHAAGVQGLKDKYYGYLTIKHPSLGTFYVSAGIRGDIRTDGKPWKFLQEDKYKLTNEQINWVYKNENTLSRFAITGNTELVLTENSNNAGKRIDESLTDEPGEYFSLLLE